MITPRWGLALLFLFSAAAHAADDGEESAPLEQSGILNGQKTEMITLEAAIEMALRNNLDAKVDHLSTLMDEDRIKNAWADFDPVLNFSSNRQHNDLPESPTGISSADAALDNRLIQSNQETVVSNAELIESQNQLQQALLSPAVQSLGSLIGALSGNNPFAVSGTQVTPTPLAPQSNAPIFFVADTFSSVASLQGKLPFGTKYSFGLEIDRYSDYIKGQNGLSPPYDNAIATISLDQPLLNNFGFDANLAGVRIARITHRISLYAWKMRIITAISTVMSTYYDMQYARENIRNIEKKIEFDERMVKENQRRVELGMLIPLDVMQARAAAASDQEELLGAKNFFMEKQFALKRAILSGANAVNDQIFIPTGPVEQLPVPDLQRDELLRQAFDFRLDYKQAIEFASRQNIVLRFARNQLLPKVDLVATVGANGFDYNYFSSAGRAFNDEGGFWSAGVTASFPLGNVAARAQYDIAVRQKQQAILQIAQAELTLTIDVDTALSRIESYRQSVAANRETQRLDEETLKIDVRRRDEGLGSTKDFLEDEHKFAQDSGLALAAVANLNKAIVQLWVATGTLLEKQRIQLNE